MSEPGQNLVLPPWIGRITQYHAVILSWISDVWITSFVHQLYTFETDLVNNFLNNVDWKALYFHRLKWLFASICKFRIALHLIGLGLHLKPSDTVSSIADLNRFGQVRVWYLFNPYNWVTIASVSLLSYYSTKTANFSSVYYIVYTHWSCGTR